MGLRTSEGARPSDPGRSCSRTCRWFPLISMAESPANASEPREPASGSPHAAPTDKAIYLRSLSSKAPISRPAVQKLWRVRLVAILHLGLVEDHANRTFALIGRNRKAWSQDYSTFLQRRYLKPVPTFASKHLLPSPLLTSSSLWRSKVRRAMIQMNQDNERNRPTRLLQPSPSASAALCRPTAPY